MTPEEASVYKSKWTFLKAINCEDAPEESLIAYQTEKEDITYHLFVLRDRDNQFFLYFDANNCLVNVLTKTDTNIRLQTAWRCLSQDQFADRIDAYFTSPTESAEYAGQGERVTIIVDGEEKYLTDVARETGFKYSTLYHRIFIAGWDVDRALTTPVAKRTQKINRPISINTRRCSRKNRKSA
jgi:uncharacterized protein YneR